MPADDIRELKLFIDNDSQLYRSQTTSILKNLMTKKGQGKYDPSKAVKLWMYLVDAGAKKYVKDQGSPGQKWNEMFTKADREAVAKELNDDFEAEAKLGNYDDLVPKKYKKGQEESEEGRVFDGDRRQALVEAAEYQPSRSIDSAVAFLKKLKEALDSKKGPHAKTNLKGAITALADLIDEEGGTSFGLEDNESRALHRALLAAGKSI
jgi:hypothetical protein